MIIPEHERVSRNLKVKTSWLYIVVALVSIVFVMFGLFIYNNYHLYTKAKLFDDVILENKRLTEVNRRLDDFALELQNLRNFRERTERTLASTNQFKTISASSIRTDSILQILQATNVDEQVYINSISSIYESIPSQAPIANPILSRPYETNLSDKSGHIGVDIVATKGAPVMASGNGTVLFSGWTTNYGYTIILKHVNDYITVYKHNLKSNVQEGQYVKRGSVIGHVGNTGRLSTGAHCHFEVWKNGIPIDPALLIKNLQ